MHGAGAAGERANPHTASPPPHRTCAWGGGLLAHERAPGLALKSAWAYACAGPRACTPRPHEARPGRRRVGPTRRRAPQIAELLRQLAVLEAGGAAVAAAADSGVAMSRARLHWAGIMERPGFRPLELPAGVSPHKSCLEYVRWECAEALPAVRPPAQALVDAARKVAPPAHAQQRTLGGWRGAAAARRGAAGAGAGRVEPGPDARSRGAKIASLQPRPGLDSDSASLCSLAWGQGVLASPLEPGPEASTARLSISGKRPGL